MSLRLNGIVRFPTTPPGALRHRSFLKESPEPRRRYDVIGFNCTSWLIWIVFILILFAPWGRGWGYQALQRS